MFKCCSIALDCCERNLKYFATVIMILSPLVAFQVELMPSSLLRPNGLVQHVSHLIITFWNRHGLMVGVRNF